MRILLAFLLLFPVMAYTQDGVIKWLKIEEAERLYKENPKPFIIDFYTDWCGWCKHMDQTTYTDQTVITLINRNFYPVKINAESSDTLVFRNKVYPPLKNGSRNVSSLAVEILGGKLSYPSTAFIYDKEKVNIIVPGYLDVVKMQAFLVYFTENVYATTNINDFITDFEDVFKPEEGKDKRQSPETYWTSFGNLKEKMDTEPKKILLFMSASWSNTSRMMEKIVFPDSVVSEIARKYFYCLHLDIQSKEEITFMGHPFANSGESNNNLHQLAIALSDKLIRIPSLYIFDEKGLLMERQYNYQTSDAVARVLDFIGSNIYKDISWDDYIKLKEIEGF